VQLQTSGYGTEKLEESLLMLLPDLRIARMDQDTTQSRKSYEQLLARMRNQDLDILLGTQMVTKGLDFENVTFVAVFDVDRVLHYPDFRAAERTFQTLVQVSGRAGRKFEQGNVMIQTYQPGHPVFADVVSGDYRSFYIREIKEREVFRYPPFVRQIAVTIRHKQADMSREAAQIMVMELRSQFGERILGPSVPSVARIRNQYIHMIYIKMERDGKIIGAIKRAIKDFQAGIVKKKSLSTVRISIDVDPQH